MDPYSSGATSTNTSRAPYISGSTLVCSSGSAFTVSSLPSLYDSVKWIVDTCLNIISGQGASSCTIASTGNGSSSVNATLYNINGDSISLPQKTVWAGKPLFDSISGPSPPYIYKGCTGQPYTFWANPARDPDSQSSYQWMVVPPYFDYYFQYQNYDWATIVFNDPYDYYQVLARATNACGATNWAFTTGEYEYIAIMDCYYFSMYPNPASDYLTITLNVPDTDKDIEIPSDLRIQIIDNAGIICYSVNKSGDSFTIPLNNLKDGNYIVSITFGNNIENLPLIIKH